MAKRLRGCRVVIPGASSGLGRAAALALARQGARLALAARRAALIEELAAECHAAGAAATAIPAPHQRPARRISAPRAAARIAPPPRSGCSRNISSDRPVTR